MKTLCAAVPNFEAYPICAHVSNYVLSAQTAEPEVLLRELDLGIHTK